MTLCNILTSYSQIFSIYKIFIITDCMADVVFLYIYFIGNVRMVRILVIVRELRVGELYHVDVVLLVVIFLFLYLFLLFCRISLDYLGQHIVMLLRLFFFFNIVHKDRI